MSNRDRFEAWYLAEFWEGSNGGRAMLKKEPCGGYTYAKPQELWKVWQAAQPAAGEPVYQRLCNGEWQDISHQAFLRIQQQPHKAETRTLWTAPPAAAHGDDRVSGLRWVIARCAVMQEQGFERVLLKAFKRDLEVALDAMRAQAGEGGE